MRLFLIVVSSRRGKEGRLVKESSRREIYFKKKKEFMRNLQEEEGIDEEVFKKKKECIGSLQEEEKKEDW